jgi:NAD(P)-dependent dehydrogenase (short-subunit alcohol dehydrogenase family)
MLLESTVKTQHRPPSLVAICHPLANANARVRTCTHTHKFLCMQSAYNAAKHGVAGFTKTLALEVGG